MATSKTPARQARSRPAPAPDKATSPAEPTQAGQARTSAPTAPSKPAAKKAVAKAAAAGKPAADKPVADKPAARKAAAKPAAGKQTSAKTTRAGSSKPVAAEVASAAPAPAPAPAPVSAKTAKPSSAAKKTPAKPGAAKPSAATPDTAPAAAPAQAPAKKAAAKKAATKPAAARPEPTAAAPAAQAEVAVAPAAEAPAPAAPPTASAKARPRRPAGKAKPPAATAAPAPQAAAEAAPEATPQAAPEVAPGAAPGAAAEPAAPVSTAQNPPPAPQPDAARPAAPAGPPDSALTLVPGDQHRLLWRAGSACPAALAQAMARRVDAQGHLPPEDDEALPALLRGAAEAGHRVAVSAEVWAHLAAHRDARSRCALLQAAYPDGPASPALQRLLGVALPLFQAEGALWAVVAGRALLADAPGLGKGVQAIAAAQLWRRHAGVRRVLVLCPPALLAHWQRAWQQLAGVAAQVMSGGLHQRQALWNSPAEVRLIAPEALASDAAHLARWAPELVIVDEPQRLGQDEHGAPAWAGLQAPHALALCGAALDTQPDLLDALVAWLDSARLGPLAALREVRAARDAQRPLSEAAIERVAAQLSRVLLQRQRDEVIGQLPPVVYAPRLLPLSAAQHEAHAQALATARQLVAGWLASGYLSDADQWRLSSALVALQVAAHRADPSDGASPLAEAVLQAGQDLLAEAADSDDPEAPPVRALLCDSDADARQWAQRLGEVPGLRLVAPGEPLPDAPDQVWQVGVPWRSRRHPIGDRERAPQGQHWVLLCARDSIDIGLIDTLAARADVPRGPAEPGGRGFLAGDKLATWLQAVAAALQAIPAEMPLVAA